MKDDNDLEDLYDYAPEWKNRVYGAYENHIMAGCLGRFALAALGSYILYKILFM